MPLIVTPRHLSNKAEFYYQLSAMIRAGLTLIKSLENLQLKPPARSYRTPIRRILEQLNRGDTFAHALHSTGHWLDAFDRALLEAGERSGRLDDCFKILASYYDNSARLIRQVIGKLLYPVGLLHLALLIFPTSQLVALVRDSDSNGFLMQKAGVFLPLYGIVFLTIRLLQTRRFELWRATIETALGFVPFLAAARKALAMSRLSAALEALINAGVGIVDAWELAAAASGSPAVKRHVMRWRPQIESGAFTPGELLRRESVFPTMFTSLYQTGELSGQLDDALLRLRGYYDEEAGRKLDTFTKMSVTLVVLGVMGMVAYFIISFYMGYFKGISDAMGGGF